MGREKMRMMIYIDAIAIAICDVLHHNQCKSNNPRDEVVH